MTNNTTHQKWTKSNDTRKTGDCAHVSFVTYLITHSSSYYSEMPQKSTTNRYYHLKYTVLSSEAYTVQSQGLVGNYLKSKTGVNMKLLRLDW